MMKIKRKKILWIRLLVYLLAMGAGTFLVHQKWDEQARATFKTALLQELQKRDTLSIPYISNWTAISALEEVNPGVVEIELDSGKRKYEIPCFKFENSLVKGGIQRGLLTALLDESPLDADSLHGTWNKLLKESDIFLKTHTRIIFRSSPLLLFPKTRRSSPGLTAFFLIIWDFVVRWKLPVMLLASGGGCLVTGVYLP